MKTRLGDFVVFRELSQLKPRYQQVKFLLDLDLVDEVTLNLLQSKVLSEARFELMALDRFAKAIDSKSEDGIAYDFTKFSNTDFTALDDSRFDVSFCSTGETIKLISFEVLPASIANF